MAQATAPLPPGWIREEDPTVPEQIPGSGAPIVPPQADPFTGQPVATPLSASYADTIDRMVTQLANRPRGENVRAISRSRKAQDLPAAIGRGVQEMAKLDPPRYTGESVDGIKIEPGEITMSEVTNPRHFLARFSAQYFPRMYQFLEKSPIKYTFEGLPMKGPAGKVTHDMAEGTARIGVRDDIANTMETLNPADIAYYLTHDPHSLYEALTTLPHELGHAVRLKLAELMGGRTTSNIARRVSSPHVREGATRLYEQGQPLEKALVLSQDNKLNVSRGVGSRIADLFRGKDSGVRIDPQIQKWVKRGYGEVTQLDEALIQQAAQNQARNAGIIPRDLATELEQIMNKRFGK